ncbi:MAG: TonB-dependent receptor plug domain-containing protein [Balneolaceae bacterium]|nr:TonB-dependent receptor plug domain-containing protein [Balneolaceae bacterium]
MLPIVQSIVRQRELEQVYNGEQPVFYLEDLTPAIFSYSESGTRLANYGSMRLRGMAQERINMTLNGVPLNDMIDHGVFFSNFTDISNSFESVQVQRGVGTSSNGVASYAGSINFESVNINDREKGGQVELGLGSFDSYRMNTSLSSGMINDKWSLYGSYSRILSDGYRYNTSTNAYSFFFSGGYFGEKDMIKINAFDARSKNGLGYSAVAKSDLQNDPRTNYLNENDKDDFGQRLGTVAASHINLAIGFLLHHRFIMEDPAGIICTPTPIQIQHWHRSTIHFITIIMG